jgi:serine/threonine protein kinase
MLYLQSKNIVHGDLALRNLLVAEGKSAHSNCRFLVKISDFGMAKVLTEGEYYSATNPILPIKV